MFNSLNEYEQEERRHKRVWKIAFTIALIVIALIIYATVEIINAIS